MLARVVRLYLVKVAACACTIPVAALAQAQQAPAGATTQAAPAPANGAAATPSPQNAPGAQTDPAKAAQTTPPPAPTPLPTPAITGPLQASPPHVIDAGILGQIDVNGIVSGMGLWQGNPVQGDRGDQAALSNGQVFVQKTTGWWQFYVQAGAYNIPALGTSFLSTEDTVSDFFGPVPVAFLKLAPGKNTSILVGALPTLIGAEYTFTFENMNVERGLLWNQENAVNRGIQLNQSFGKFTASLAYNDGFYSDRFTWLTGALTYANGPHSLSFVAGGNFDETAFRTPATPIQNNSTIYNVIYTYTKGSWIVQPYFQHTSVPTEPQAGIPNGADTWGGAVLLSHTFGHGVSLAGRGEYITSTGSAAEQSANLIFGPGSSGWSITVTPTYQHGAFFARGDISFVRANDITPGDAFGRAGTERNQPRAVGEIGFLF